MNKFLLLAIAIFINTVAIAQQAAKTSAETDGVMRSSGKIYVVMAIVITILAGLILYVIRLDRKITRLEKGSY